MSDKVLELLGLIDTKQNELGVAIKAAQDINDKLEKGQTELQGSFKKASEDAETKLEEHQVLKAQVESIGKTAEFLEKSIARMGDAGGAHTSELEKKAHDEMCRYLRHGTELSDDVKAAVVTSMTDTAYHGMDETEKANVNKSLIAGSNAEGGYFIRPERSAQIVSRIFETSPVRQLANVVTTASDSLEIVIDDDEADTGGWVGEIDDRNETGTPKIGLLTIPVHEQYAQPLATQKMLDDAGFDVEAWLAGKVQRKMGRTENTSFVVGDGSQKPKGFLAYNPWTVAGAYERNKLEQLNSGFAAAVDGDSFKKLQNALIEEYQGDAVFTMKREAFLPVITLKDSAGRYIFQSRFINDKDEMRLLGKPVVFMNDMPTVAANSLSYAYGNFREGYTVVDRIGFRAFRDMYTKKPYIKFYTTKRTGGAVTNFESIKIMKLAV